MARGPPGRGGRVRARADQARVPHRRGAQDPLRRVRRRIGHGVDPDDEPVAREHVRVRADLDLPRAALSRRRGRPAGLRGLRAQGRPPLPARHGRLPRSVHRAERAGRPPPGRPGRRHGRRPLRRRLPARADLQRGGGQRRCGRPDPADRAARGVGPRPRPGSLPGDGPARRRRRGARHDRGLRAAPRDPRGLHGVLRRRPLRRVDALRPPLPRRAPGARAEPSGDRDPGPDHRRPAGPGRPARQRRVPRRAPAQQPARGRGRRALRVGGGGRRVRVHRLGLGDGRPPRRAAGTAGDR